jgi:heme/copper-type cytochrome/quinol oxidase subunit 2
LVACARILVFDTETVEGCRMDSTRLLDSLPLWALFVLTVVTVVVAVELGYRLGQFRRRRSEEEKEAPVGAIVGATLGLLAFMLAFTFSLAATRFDSRRMVVLD